MQEQRPDTWEQDKAELKRIRKLGESCGVDLCRIREQINDWLLELIDLHLRLEGDPATLGSSEYAFAVEGPDKQYLVRKTGDLMNSLCTELNWLDNALGWPLKDIPPLS